MRGKSLHPEKNRVHRGGFRGETNRGRLLKRSEGAEEKVELSIHSEEERKKSLKTTYISSTQQKKEERNL